MLRGLVVGMLLAVVGVTAACGGDDASPSDAPAVTASSSSGTSGAAGTASSDGDTDTDGALITAAVFQFTPRTLEVPVGTTVRWENTDQILHTATSGVPEAPDGTFDGRMNGAGTSFEFTFDEPGSYSFFCSRHLHMRGEVVVR